MLSLRRSRASKSQLKVVIMDSPSYSGVFPKTVKFEVENNHFVFNDNPWHEYRFDAAALRTKVNKVHVQVPV